MKNTIFNLKYNPLFYLVLLICGCGEQSKTIQKQEDAKEAFLLKKDTIGKTLQVPAELLPFERTDIHARVEGFVQRVAVDIGDRVSKGQVLAVLEAPEAGARYAEASAKQQQAQAKYRASLDKFSRIKSASLEIGTVAESELVQARNEMLADSSALLSAQSMARAYRQLENYLVIRAPFSGKITKRNANSGDLVGPDKNSALFSLERTDMFRLHVHVPEAYTTAISSEALSFTVDAFANKAFNATLARKSGNISPDTRTELWEYIYDNREGDLKPGMYASVKLLLNRPTAAFVVPKNAIATTQERKFVICIRQGKTQWVDVRSGISTDEGIELFGNLSVGDTLLARASDEIRPGLKLKLDVK